jgi:hypothetical protein
MGTHKIEVKGIKVEADNARDAIVLFDKAVQYSKILTFPNDTLLHCLSCGSYDIEAQSPDFIICNVCGAEMEFYEEEIDENN